MINPLPIFSLNPPTGPIQSKIRNIHESCVYVCAIAETPLPSGPDTSDIRAYR